MSFTVIIPARSASTRLPGKPLLDLDGLPMVVRTARQSAASNASRVVIATDHEAIQKVAQTHHIEALMTHPDHPTGTDRLSEAVGALGLDDTEIVVNVQGDEPLIEPALINAVADTLARHPTASMATCAAPIANAQALFNPNVVKVVCDATGHALYFSRAPIPWARDALADGQPRLAPGLPALHHIGLYAYRVGFLRQFPQLPQGVLEKVESLEQLRALEHGHRIAVHAVHSIPVAGIDTPEDLHRVRQALAARARPAP